jgi:2-C-methyl-D-erythritol 2,4-cyclodiphosphate synthase
VTRTGWGFDAHRFGGIPPIVLGGAIIDEGRGVMATSDGDVAAHAVADALLGAANLGDLGTHFPSSDEQWADADSLQLLNQSARLADDAGVTPLYVDVTILAEDVRIAPHRGHIRAGLARALDLDAAAVSVKATTTDGLGFIGRSEGIAAMAVVTVEAAS